MSDKTGIEWCDSTVNPTTGCEGCELWNGHDVRACYAGNLHENRFAKTLPILYAENFQDVRLAPGRMMRAARWPDLRGKDRHGKPWLNGMPRMIFVGDMGDFCSCAVPDDYIENEIIDAIKSPEGSRHFWLLLTKQIRRLADLSRKIGGLPDNCMAMTTVTNQHYADKRIPDLLKVKCLWRGISAEPLLGPIDLRLTVEFIGGYVGVKDIASDLHLLIAGGESGPHARPLHPVWVYSLRDQCQSARVPFFLKQWGEFASYTHGHLSANELSECWDTRTHITVDIDGRHLTEEDDDRQASLMIKVGKKRAGRLLDGREYNEFPEVAG